MNEAISSPPQADPSITLPWLQLAPVLMFDGAVIKTQQSLEKRKKKNNEQCPSRHHCPGEQSQKTSPCGETILEQETDTDPLPVQGLNLGTATFGAGPQ